MTNDYRTRRDHSCSKLLNARKFSDLEPADAARRGKTV